MNLLEKALEYTRYELTKKYRCKAVSDEEILDNIHDCMEQFGQDNDLPEGWWMSYGDIHDIFVMLQEADTAHKEPNVSRYHDGTTIILYEPVAVLSRGANLLYEKDMSHVTAIDDAIREPTKWEVLKAAYYLWRHLRKGKGLSRNVFTNTWALLRAAPWKASHASREKETTTAPEPSASHSDTECRPPQQGQTSSEHSRSMERNT